MSKTIPWGNVKRAFLGLSSHGDVFQHFREADGGFVPLSEIVSTLMPEVDDFSLPLAVYPEVSIHMMLAAASIL